MAFKVVVLFNGTTVNEQFLPAMPGSGGVTHSFGFSEGYLTSTGDFNNEVAFLRNGFGPKRAAILPPSTRIIGARFYQPGGGRAVPVALSLPGTSNITGLANKAVLCTSNNANAAVARKWWVHNVPDAQVVGGEFRPSNFFASRFVAYLDEIAQASWLGLVRSNNIAVVTIDAAGLVTCPSAHSFNVGQFVTLTKTLLSSGQKFGGLFRVSTVGPLSSQLTLLDWDQGAATGGNMFLKTTQAYVIGASGRPIVNRAGTRRVGRPFDLYRGRSSRRRVSS